MAKPLTEVCGKRSPLGGFEREPMKYSQAKEKYDQWDLEQKEFTLKFRDDIDQQSGEVRELLGPLLDESKAKNEVTLTIARTYHPGLRRNQVHTKKVPTDKPFTVPSKIARRIMNHEAYSYLFDEVDDGAAQTLQSSQAVLLKPGQYDIIEKMLKTQQEQAERLNALAAENAALKNIVGAPPASSPSGDTDEDDTTTTDKTPAASTAPSGAPPKPGKKAQAAATPPPATTPGG